MYKLQNTTLVRKTTQRLQVFYFNFPFLFNYIFIEVWDLIHQSMENLSLDV